MKNVGILRVRRLRPVSRYIELLEMSSYKQGNPEITDLRWSRYQLVINTVRFHLWKNISAEVI